MPSLETRPLTLPFPFKLSTGPRAHLPNPHSANDLPPKIPPHDLPLRRRGRLGRRPSPRPFQTLRPQNNVPAHLQPRREHPTALLRPETTDLVPKTALRAPQRPQIHASTLRHERGHDGDLHRRTGRSS